MGLRASDIGRSPSRAIGKASRSVSALHIADPLVVRQAKLCHLPCVMRDHGGRLCPG